MKHVIIIPTENNHRILVTDNVAPYTGKEGIFIDPDLSRVKGIAPHYWKWDGQYFIPMDAFEKKAVDDTHKKMGIKNTNLYEKKHPANIKRLYWGKWVPYVVYIMGWIGMFLILHK